MTLVQLLSHGFSRVICSELFCLPALPEMPQAPELRARSAEMPRNRGSRAGAHANSWMTAHYRASRSTRRRVLGEGCSSSRSIRKEAACGYSARAAE
ncbi:hypothetical protein ABIB64_006640 [Bradyrhizobium sp. F1.1.1]